MKTIYLSLVLLTTFILLVPTSAFAQIDSGPNGIGIYFDMDATITTATAEVGDIVEAYLIGTNLLLDSGDMGWWEVKVCPTGGGLVSGIPTHNGFNQSMNMPGDGCWTSTTGYFDPPLMPEAITVLATLSIEIYDTLIPVGLYIRPGAEYWLYEIGMDGIALNPSTGSFDLPVAMINGEAPVANDGVVWGSVKSMFR